VEICVALRGPSMFNRWLKRAPHHNHSAVRACLLVLEKPVDPVGTVPGWVPACPLVFAWRKPGEPAVVPPQKSGYGTSTNRDVISYKFAGVVDLTFAVSGVQCRIELPADWLSNDGEPTWAASEKQQAGTEIPFGKRESARRKPVLQGVVAS
jgi:hypothetical protein